MDARMVYSTYGIEASMTYWGSATVKVEETICYIVYLLGSSWYYVVSLREASELRTSSKRRVESSD